MSRPPPPSGASRKGGLVEATPLPLAAPWPAPASGRPFWETAVPPRRGAILRPPISRKCILLDNIVVTPIYGRRSFGAGTRPSCLDDAAEKPARLCRRGGILLRPLPRVTACRKRRLEAAIAFRRPRKEADSPLWRLRLDSRLARRIPAFGICGAYPSGVRQGASRRA